LLLLLLVWLSPFQIARLTMDFGSSTKFVECEPSIQVFPYRCKPPSDKVAPVDDSDSIVVASSVADATLESR